jgi:hypothetical protein
MLSRNKFDLTCFGSHKNLQTLLLADCYFSRITGLEYCKYLTHIELNDCGELDIFFTNPVCKNLKKLLLCGYRDVKIKNTDFLIYFNKLESFSISNNQILEELNVNYNSNLKTINLYSCENLYKVIINSNILKHLKITRCLYLQPYNMIYDCDMKIEYETLYEKDGLGEFDNFEGDNWCGEF